MSTRSSIYYHEADTTPEIHIYRELADEDDSLAIRMEVELGWGTANFPLPVDLQEKLGIKR